MFSAFGTGDQLTVHPDLCEVTQEKEGTTAGGPEARQPNESDAWKIIATDKYKLRSRYELCDIKAKNVIS